MLCGAQRIKEYSHIWPKGAVGDYICFLDSAICHELYYYPFH